jgi:hypothetical protein
MDCLLAETKIEERFTKYAHMMAPRLELEQVMDASSLAVRRGLVLYVMIL